MSEGNTNLVFFFKVRFYSQKYTIQSVEVGVEVAVVEVNLIQLLPPWI